jgi:hypothetical protein
VDKKIAEEYDTRQPNYVAESERIPLAVDDVVEFVDSADSGNRVHSAGDRSFVDADP